MPKCPHCKREFPFHLLSQMFISDEHGSGYIKTCPICALKMRNEMHGIPEGTMFQGEIAQDAYEEAEDWLATQGGN